MDIYSKGSVKDGILRAKLDNFKELFEFSQFFHQGPGGFYFRGQADERWGLTTTLERFESGINKYVSGTRQHMLADFKRLLRGKGLLSQMNINSDEEIFALGQHYGLPTPLLDWSESFYIALFFAFAEDTPKDAENVAVWAIQYSAKELMEAYNIESRSRCITDDDVRDFLPIQFVDPYTDVNSRLVSQSGVFIQKPSGVDLEKIVASYCSDNNDSPVLAKITIPVAERESVVNNLFAMNINWSTIYPGIDGAARHAKMKLQMMDLKVRKMGELRTRVHANRDIRK
ncbi:FRG domain-containing protein [Pseudomonas gessardii]|uniref:FRG domain-containing protein n=1 Tax=Pseudomonas gessardii TaxID=78544 RepID=UPI001473637B|nr:FRG domain-containing protein [Pseudomonas gessardii]NNA66417.1 FRG domain-containing protein [Pseudomonas gessardii]